MNSSEIITLVRGGDYDRFLAIQLAPMAKRAALYAVTALHVEVARIAESVSEPLIGHIRLAWWRETLEEMIAGKPSRNHPVLLALSDVHAKYSVVLPLLLTMIEARAADLDDSLLAEEAAWIAYCDATSGALHAAWAQILDSEAAQAHDASVRAAARSYAIIGLARAIPFMAQHCWARFPQARLSAHQLESLAPSANLNGFVRALLTEVVGELNTSNTDPRLLPLIGTVELAKMHAKTLQKAGYDPYAKYSNKLGIAWKITKIKYL